MRNLGVFLVEETLERRHRRVLRSEQAVGEIAAPLIVALRGARALSRSDITHALEVAELQVRQTLGEVSELEDFELRQFFERLNRKVLTALRKVQPIGFEDEPSCAA